MIEQQGRVVEVLPLQARIEVGPAQGCSHCASGKGCGAGLFVRLINRKPTRLLIEASQPLHKGQSVTVGIPESLFLRWVACLYGLPLLAAFAIAIPVQAAAGQIALSPGLTDLAVLTGFVAGFVSMLAVLKRQLATRVSEATLYLLSARSSPESVNCAAGN